MNTQSNVAASSGSSPSPCSTFWVDAAVELPDDDMAVLVALDDGEVWTGFRDAGQWRYVSADLIEAGVTHWAEFPAPPALRCPKCGSEDTWFDRTIEMRTDGTEDGMKTRCAGCGRDIDESNTEVCHGANNQKGNDNE